MPRLTMIALFAGTLAVAGYPASAVDLPDYGSKNFSPSGDTPTYFTNESAPVSARTADITQRDWSAVDAMAPARPAASTSQVDSGRGGRHASTRRLGRHGLGKARHGAHETRYSASVRAGGKRAGRAATAATSGTRSQARAVSAKHAKGYARHIRAGIAKPAASSRMAALSN